MLFSQAKGRNVVALTTAETLATVTGFAIAPAPARIAALRVKTRGPGTQVTWNNVHSFGPDAVTVRTPDKIRATRTPPPPPTSTTTPSANASSPKPDRTWAPSTTSTSTKPPATSSG